ncbi:hypothetical protein IAT40_004031 [Kwoniella sp. CBS 6097]
MTQTHHSTHPPSESGSDSSTIGPPTPTSSSAGTSNFQPASVTPAPSEDAAVASVGMTFATTTKKSNPPGSTVGAARSGRPPNRIHPSTGPQASVPPRTRASLSAASSRTPGVGNNSSTHTRTVRPSSRRGGVVHDSCTSHNQASQMNGSILTPGQPDSSRSTSHFEARAHEQSKQMNGNVRNREVVDLLTGNFWNNTST